MTIEDQVKEVTAKVVATQAQLGRLSKIDPAREVVKAELAELLAVLASKKAEAKRVAARSCFAGIGSPLHEVIVARIDPSLVAELEREAIARQAEREQRAAARRAAKAAASSPTEPATPPPVAAGAHALPPPKPVTPGRRVPPAPEVIVRRPHAAGGAS